MKETHEQIAVDVNRYFKKGNVMPIVEEVTGEPCLLIQLSGCEYKATVPVGKSMERITAGESPYILVLKDILKTVERAASKIPTRKANTYFPKDISNL